MRLYVTDEIKKELSFDAVTMTIREFNDIHNHPFIASSKFDEVVVDINSDVKIGYLEPLIKTTKVIPRIVGDITSHTISLLSEIYRDRSAELRFTFIRDKAGIVTLINQMKADYGWERFY